MQDPKQRFLSKIRTDSFTGCWNWTGTIFEGRSKGAFWWKGKLWIASRAAWFILRGEIPQGKMVCHTCDNDRCVNPDHLYVGDQASNMADRHARGRTNRWDKRYNFVQTPELEAKVKAMREAGDKISDICLALDIGRTTYYRIAGRVGFNLEKTQRPSRAAK